MITDCRCLLENLAVGLERFATLNEGEFAAFVKCESGLFHAISNGVVTSPYVVMIDDDRIDWGNDSITELNNQLRGVGLIRQADELRRDLERLLTDVMRLQQIVGPKIKSADYPYRLIDVLGEDLCECAIGLQRESERLLCSVVEILGKLPADEPVTPGQLAKCLQKFVKGEYRQPDPREVRRELEKPGAPEPATVEDCPQLKGKTSRKWMRDEALTFFSKLSGWRTD